MGIFEFLMNQHFSYYGRLISFFMIIGIIAFFIILIKFQQEIKKSMIISGGISFILIVFMVWLGHSMYNNYEEYKKSISGKSELEKMVLEMKSMKNLDESVMDFLKVKYSKVE